MKLLRDDMAIRHPKRGKAHRSVVVRHDVQHGITEHRTACGRTASDKTELIPVERTAEEDRCTVCWPPAS